MAGVGGGSKYLTGFKDADKDVSIVLSSLGFSSKVVAAAAFVCLCVCVCFWTGGWVLQEEDGETISVHATDGGKNHRFWSR
jgi:hypothetical protein